MPSSLSDTMPDKSGVTFCPTNVSNVQELSPVNLGPHEERKLWRRIDFRLVPMIFLMYLFSFMDRGGYCCFWNSGVLRRLTAGKANIGNAKLEGLMTQLHLTGTQFNVALSVFFISYSLFEFPANVILQSVRPSRWLPGIMFAWGIIMTFMGLVKSYPQLAGVRFLLGIAEAGFYPGVVFYLSMWYPKYKLIYRVAFFSSAAAVAGGFSGLLAYAIGFMNNLGHLEGWSWIFIIQGLATIVVSFVGVFALVDYPDTAKFLSAEEKRFIEQQRTLDIDDDGESTVTQHILSAFADWQVWSMGFLLMFINVPAYGITFFLPYVLSTESIHPTKRSFSTILNNFGYDTAISQLLTVPVYLAAAISMISVARFSDSMKIRFPFIIVSALVGLAGYIIQITDASTGVKYFGTFLAVIGGYSGFPCVIGWLANNLRGKYKRAVGMAIQVGMGNLGGVIASNIFQAQDEPRYILACELPPPVKSERTLKLGGNVVALEIGFLCMVLIVAVFTVYAYHRANTARIASAKRDEINEAGYAVGLYVI
ncbi:MFS general substrate transporter [Pisolithus sp. B1]|nr:MFS general substrate transporter [Pisolithus sp. B1]